MSNSPEATVEFSFYAGSFVRWRLRHELKVAELHGIKWVETKGFLGSRFTVHGPLRKTKELREKLMIMAEKQS